MDTPGKEFVDLIAKTLGFTFGENIFYMRQPEASDKEVIWVTLTSGSISREMRTYQQIKEYNFTLNYRNISARQVDEKMNEIENVLSHMKCFNLPSYEVISLRVSNLGSQQDADSENRFRGTLQLVLQIYDDFSKDN